MKILTIIFAFFSVQAWSTSPVDCGDIIPIEGVIEITHYDCANDFCGVRIIAPDSLDNRKFLSFTLMLGSYPEPKLGVQLEYVAHGGIVDAKVYGHPETLSQYRVWAAYGEEKGGMCPRHSVVNLKQHNKTSQGDA